MQATIGMVGLAVMGKNLALNIADHGFSVAVYNRPEDGLLKSFANEHTSDKVLPCETLEDFTATLQKPRVIMMMVRAGEPVDLTIASLLPFLEEGDILIDGGNSHYPDTERRYAMLAEKGIRYIGAGVSGGEEGARHGPAIMPGGDATAWPVVQPVFEAIAASVNNTPCSQWVGPGSSGHFVKMVHNGIEYGDMQLIAEACDLMLRGLGMSHAEVAEVFQQWNQGVLSSFLVEITANIFTVLDEDGEPLVEKILDKAGQKGTGKWTAINALELGMPLGLVSEAVFARNLSALKDQREVVAVHFEAAKPDSGLDRQNCLKAIHDALYAAKIMSYTQGFMLIAEMALEQGWDIDYGNIALTWRGGCIIRSAFLDDIHDAYRSKPDLHNLLLDPFFQKAVSNAEPGWRQCLQTGIALGVPLPAMSSALAFFDGLRSARVPANILQAQRDYFGAHGYQRVDDPAGQPFHSDWLSLAGINKAGGNNA